MAEVIKAHHIAGKFGLPEDQVASRLMRACARAEIAAWAGRAFFNEGANSHSETDWPIPPEAWATPSGHSLGGTTRTRPNPFFSLNDGTLHGEGFSPVPFLQGSEPSIVDMRDVSFCLSRIVFDAQDVAYYLEKSSSLPASPGNLQSSAPRQTARADQKGAPGAKPDAKRWEQFAAGLLVQWEKGELQGKSVSAIHGKVADYLSERGHEKSLGVDTVKSLILRVQAWTAGYPYVGDGDYEG